MNSINRVGQKCICIQPADLWQDFFCGLCWPVLDAVYTVAGFADIEGCPGVYLYELPPVSCQCHQLEGAPWPLDLFRALDTRSTEISMLKKILEPEDVAA